MFPDHCGDMTRARGRLLLFVLIASLGAVPPARAESGYELWLRYVPLTEPARRAYAPTVRGIVVEGHTPTDGVIAAELRRGLGGLLAAEVPRWDSVQADGALVVGTPSSSPLVAALGWAALARVADEGYVIRATRIEGHPVTVIGSSSEEGALHSAFHFLLLL